jgi:hypothetical protein
LDVRSGQRTRIHTRIVRRGRVGLLTARRVTRRSLRGVKYSASANWWGMSGRPAIYASWVR